MNDYKYFSIKEIVNNDKYPFTLGQLRHYLQMRHKNGLNGTIRKIGKRLYLRKDLFDQWIENQGQGGKYESV